MAGCQGMQEVEQDDRVNAPGDRDDRPLAVGQEVPLPNRQVNLAGQIVHLVILRCGRLVARRISWGRAPTFAEAIRGRLRRAPPASLTPFQNKLRGVSAQIADDSGLNVAYYRFHKLYV